MLLRDFLVGKTFMMMDWSSLSQPCVQTSLLGLPESDEWARSGELLDVDGNISTDGREWSWAVEVSPWPQPRDRQGNYILSMRVYRDRHWWEMGYHDLLMGRTVQCN